MDSVSAAADIWGPKCGICKCMGYYYVPVDPIGPTQSLKTEGTRGEGRALFPANQPLETSRTSFVTQNSMRGNTKWSHCYYITATTSTP